MITLSDGATTRLPRILASTLLAIGLAAGCAASSAGSAAASAVAKPASAKPSAPKPATRTAAAAAAQSAALVRAGGARRLGVQPAATAPSGYDPTDLRSAYNLASAAAGGKNATVAIVDIGDDPTASADLGVYRTQYGLTACTTASGCLRKVNQQGQASPLPNDQAWSPSWAIDMDMVSAICPNCHILLVEADFYYASDMGAAVNSAVSLGAKYVIVGWGDTSYGPNAAGDASYFNHPGVAIAVPGGDAGFLETQAQNDFDYPATSPYVTSVGGTTLQRASNARGWTETVWAPNQADDNSLGTSSGCALGYARPSWETGAGCAGRTHNDVAAVADPATGVAFYNGDPLNGDPGWRVAGGTTVSASIVGAVYALAGPPAAGSYPASYPYQSAAGLNPVTSGSNVLPGDAACNPAYLCTAGPGYNGPAGLGTPDGTGAFAVPATASVTLIGPAEQTAIRLPAPVSLQLPAGDSAGNPLSYTATGLPPGVAINPATGLISGAVTHEYDGTTTVTATDSTGASATATISWDEVNDLILGNPGTLQTEPNTPVSLQMSASEPDSQATVAYTATGLPPGLAIDPATGLISGTTGATIASYDVTVSATDSTGASSTRSFTWNVWNKITLTGPTFEQSHIGVPVSVTIGATDSAPGATVTLSATGLPAGLSLDPATGVISGTPTSLTYPGVTVTATDGTASTAAISIAWAVGGVITVGQIAAQTSVVGQPVDVTTSERDNAPYDYITYGGLGLPPGLGVGENGPSIEGTATATGTYQVTLDVNGSDGGLGTVTFTWTVLPAPDAGPTGPVPMGADGKCVDDTGDSSANGTKVQVWACNGGASQRWTYAEDDTLRVHGDCLAAAGSAAGSKIILTPCAGTAGQRWDARSDGWLINQVTGLCLRDPDLTGKSNGVQLEALDCLGTNEGTESWTLPAGPIQAPIGGTCLDDYDAVTRAGAEVDLASCTGSARQDWTVEPDGTVRIFGLCLTTNTVDATVGTHVTLQKCGAGSGQDWGPAYESEFTYELVAPIDALLAGPGNVIARPGLVRLVNAPSYYVWHIW